MNSIILEISKKAALAGADFVRSKFGKLDNIEIEIKSQNDFVTEVDRESERIVIDEIRKHFPDHGIIGEELGTHGNGEYNWIIDPLDGTKNFIQGIPAFAVSVGVQFQDKVVAGAVADVMNGDIYYASTGGGAFKNGDQIHVSSKDKITDAFFATGFPFRHKAHIPNYIKALETLLEKASGARRIGAAALDLCWLAQGSFDFFFEVGLNAWDIAAGSIIISEAGGTISDFDGESNYLFGKQIIASNGLLHNELLALIPNFFFDQGDTAG